MEAHDGEYCKSAMTLYLLSSFNLLLVSVLQYRDIVTVYCIGGYFCARGDFILGND
jgi:hypothetical protein